MKKNAFILILSIIVVSCFTLLPSCRKSAFPRDPYRGSSANPKSHPQKHDKAKSTRSYRSIRAKRTY